jgi:hypothetical protein
MLNRAVPILRVRGFPCRDSRVSQVFLGSSVAIFQHDVEPVTQESLGGSSARLSACIVKIAHQQKERRAMSNGVRRAGGLQPVMCTSSVSRRVQQY